MKSKFSWIAVLPSLVIPVCGGLMMYLALSLTIEKEVLTSEWLIRYLTGHSVSKFTVAMFFVGVSSLLMISWNIWQQFGWEPSIELEASESFESSEDQPSKQRSAEQNDVGVERATAILQLLSERNIVIDELERPDSKTADVVFARARQADDPIETSLAPSHSDLNQPTDSHERFNTEQLADTAADLARGLLTMPAKIHDHYLWRRLYEALGFVHRTGSAHAIEDELKYLSDIDGERQQQRYSLVRILIWATPMLGFLGTVLGISQALGGINVGPDNDFQLMMNGLSSSLYIAFDTTALALVLSMGLMFCQFVVDRFESQLLSLVNVRAKSEIAEHFDMSQQADSGTRSMEAIGSAVLQSTQDVVKKQTELWRQSIHAAEQAWIESLTGANQHVEESLGVAVDESVGTLASYMSQAIERADVAMAHRWKQWQVSLSENARMMNQHHEELVRQSKNIEKLLGNFGEADSFRKAIEQNQQALDATNQLHQTMVQLSGTIQNLDGRIDENSQATTGLIENWTTNLEQIRLYQPPETGRAESETTQDTVAPADPGETQANEIFEPRTLQIPDFEEPSHLNIDSTSKRSAA